MPLLSPLFKFGTVPLRPPQAQRPVVVENPVNPITPPPPPIGPPIIGVTGGTTVTCPCGSYWDPNQQACVSTGVVPNCPSGTHWDPNLCTCISDATITVTSPTGTTGTAPGTTVNVPPGAGGGGGSGGEGPITVNVANAVTVADSSAASAIDSVASAVRNGISVSVNQAAAAANASATAIQEGINNLTTGLADGIDRGFQDIAGVINGIGNGVTSAVGSIVGTVSNSIFNAINPITTGLAGIIQIISSQIGGLAGAIGSAVANVIPIIVAAIQGAISPGQAVLGVIENEISSAVVALAQIATDLGQAGTGLDASLQRLLSTWEGYNTPFVESQTGYPDGGSLHSDLSNIWKAISGLVTSLIGTATFRASDVLAPPCNSKTVEGLLNAPYNFGNAENSFWKDFTIALWTMVLNLGKIFPAILKVNEILSQDVNQDCPAGLLSPGNLVEAELRGFLTHTQTVSEAGRANLDPTRYQTLLNLAVHQMSPEQLVEALFRGLITPADYQASLTAQGWTAGQGNILQGVGFNLLTVTELWELMRRGAIGPDVLDASLKTLHYDDAQRKALASLTFRPANMQEAIDGAYSVQALQALGALSEANPNGYPEFVSAAAAAEGLSTEAAGARWVRHWETGSIGLWLDLYYRGLASAEQLQGIFRRNYIPDPLQIFVIEGSRPLLQFRTITRMVQLNILTPSQGAAQLKKHGYSDADVAVLIDYAQATKKVPAAQRAAQTHAISIGIAKEEYIDGSITAAQFYDVLIAHGFTPEGANTEIAVVDAHEAMLARKANAQLIVDEYGAGLISEQVALAELASQGLTVAELARYSHKIRAFRVKNAKLPTEAELLKFLKAGLISHDEYINTLVAQGYAPKWANAFYDLGVPANPPAATSGGTAQTSPPTAP